MKGKKNKTPRYAIRLVILVVGAGVIFFAGLRFFVPEGSKLTGSYDAASLLYIAEAPVAYRGSDSCGSANCHSLLFNKWSEGAHGARNEQSKCEVCHGPQGKHPETQLPKVRGDGNVVELCLSCHRKLKARSTTGQPQISPQDHPAPHEGVLKCTQCHDPHSPGFGSPESDAKVTQGGAGGKDKGSAPEEPSIASKCFSCHGPSGRGGFAPQLAGQSYQVLKDKLTKFRSGELTGKMMNPIASEMKDKEIDTLAQYFAGLS
jgi:cytochrome c553